MNKKSKGRLKSRLRRKRRSKTVPATVYTVNEFLLAHKFCRATLYKLWRDGGGPRRMTVLGRTLISVEAAADWRREREAASGAAR